MKITGLILALNESPRITDCLSHLKPFLDYLVVVDGGSVDDTYAKAAALADRAVKRKRLGDWCDEKNYIETLAPDDTDWYLHADVDERFHERLLPEIKTVVEGVTAKYPETIAFRFPRANLDINCSDYPDYQVRLLKKGSGYKWIRPLHSIPAIDGVILDTIRGKCMTMLDMPIWHLPRRTDIRRPWWSDEKGRRDKTEEEMRENE